MITFILISSFSNFFTFSKVFQADSTKVTLQSMAGGAVSLKNLTKREEVRKGADQANRV